MLDGSIELDWLAGPLVEAMVENRFDAAVAVGAGRKCSAGGRLQALLAVAVGQAQAPRAGTERRRGVASGTKHVGAQLGGVRSDGCGPADEALRRPLTHRPVLLGHGLIGGGMAAFERGAYVAGDALAAVDALHGGGGEPHVELASDQGVGDGAGVALPLDVAVDVDPRLLPLGEPVGRGGKGAKRRALGLLEQRAPSCGACGQALDSRRIPDCSVIPPNPSTEQSGQFSWGSHGRIQETTVVNGTLVCAAATP